MLLEQLRHFRVSSPWALKEDAGRAGALSLQQACMTFSPILRVMRRIGPRIYINACFAMATNAESCQRGFFCAIPPSTQ
ncbi:uncharacterized protein A1O5_02559 [Cladophialophora psammophila CBS 110553]|uniref:Uncharacterized protein n=1 Tax=Cladophialophora psammophila CBS 110553 TaxID=1182543 RepID=W9X241_9EURO|nr:uncharacterized protein A1O5_02559 [Cladophialophora psammophila CBS 110553]EXJ74263.1 hypothetical protein A1O5_02559 [Cladophialophora psammophila CBS 110553]